MRLSISGYNDAAAAWDAVNTAGLECVSPLEKAHALLWRISELVEAKAPSATLRLWRQYAELTEFLYASPAKSKADLHWQNSQEREDLDVEAEGVRTTTFMRILQVNWFASIQNTAMLESQRHMWIT